MLDDLRDSVGDDFDFEDDDGDDLGLDFGDEDESSKKRSKRGFLGMTPTERMVLAVMFFLNVAVLGIALLVVTGRIG